MDQQSAQPKSQRRYGRSEPRSEVQKSRKPQRTALELRNCPHKEEPYFEKLHMNPSSAPPATAQTPVTAAPDPTASTATSISAVGTPDANQNNTQLLMAKQPRSQPPPQPPHQAQPEEASVAAVQAHLTVYEPVILPRPNPPPSTKLHPRPRKIRKLSSDAPSADSAIVAVEPEPIKPTASTPRNSRSRAIASQSGRAHPPVVPRARPLSCEGEVEIALRHLRNADPHLARLIDLHQPPTFDSFQTPFLALTKSILYQQLAYKAGTSIYARFIALCGGESGVVPDTVRSLTPQQLRQIGVSSRKASYLHDLARKYLTRILSDSSIMSMDDKSLFTMLTMVNGIGSWSVHMFMIFSLYRPDVLPVNDLGVRKGVQLLYGLDELPRPSQMEQLCEKWRPYRSVASWYLWRFVEAKGSPSSAAAVATAGLSLQHQQQKQQMLAVQQQSPPQFIHSLPGIDIRACAWGQSMT
ncbi:hypothetical protein Dimus_025547 [Dionaea muscipula]